MKHLFIAFAMLLATMSIQAQETIKLQVPTADRGTSVMKALADRHSTREFVAKALSAQDLADLLWAATGQNRADGRRTSPSAMNKQDVDVYVVLPAGAYLYSPAKHALKLITKGDFREAVAGPQAFAKDAGACLVLVGDAEKWDDPKKDYSLVFGIDAGVISQNISLFCSAVGMNTVPRIAMNQTKLREVLKLRATQQLIMNHPVGYSK